MYNSHYQGYTEPDYPTFIEEGMDSTYSVDGGQTFLTTLYELYNA